MKEIARGAEAILYKENNKLVKVRIKKDYRHEKIDFAIRKYRTRREARIMQKAFRLIAVPLIHKVDETRATLVMDWIEGKKLSEWFERFSKIELKEISLKIGKAVAELHNAGIIHGDLTTSNMIYKDKDIYFIDFGLAFHSQRIEDKAVDIYLLLQALKSKHWKIFKEVSEIILNTYFKFVEESEKIKQQLEKVEKRGRYKKQN